MARRRSPGSGPTTPIVLKALIIFNLSATGSAFPSGRRTIPGFSRRQRGEAASSVLFGIEEQSPAKAQGRPAGGFRGDSMRGILAPLLSPLPPSFGSDFNPTINGASDSSQHSRS